MGGACSRKRDQREEEENLNGGVSRRYGKSGSSKWLATSFSRQSSDIQLGKGKCPSLMDLCIHKIREVLSFSGLACFWGSFISGIMPIFPFFLLQDIAKYKTFSMLPRDISQQIFNDLVYSRCLTEVSLEAFRDCALQVYLIE